MELKGKKIIVVGLGRSGVAAADLCVDRGAQVVATDRLDRAKVSPKVLALEDKGVELCLGGHEGVAWSTCDLVVVSPGVPPFAALETAERAGAEVIGELELACRFVQAPIAVIGGTNGKSTVTTWVGAMLEEPDAQVFVGGNLGTPLAEHVQERFDRVVLEVSSFQAERVPALHPRAAALLNISDDHLDRYAGFDDYAWAKGNVFVNMDTNDTAVIPVGDAACEAQAKRGKAQVVTFGPGGDIAPEGDTIVDRLRDWRFDRATIRVPGHHNVLNACASIAVAAALGASRGQINDALARFRGLPHRTVRRRSRRRILLQRLEGNERRAAVAALRGLRQPKAVLIAGGRDKQGSYAPLVDALRDRGRALVVMGEAADRIGEAAAGVVDTLRADSMAEAVRLAKQAAQPGDAVLLSPACASFDMFHNYAERGDLFCAAVASLATLQDEEER